MQIGNYLNILESCTRCQYYVGCNNGSCLMMDINNLADNYYDQIYEKCEMREPLTYDYWKEKGGK